jgi:hypothetical protein
VLGRTPAARHDAPVLAGRFWLWRGGICLYLGLAHNPRRCPSICLFSSTLDRAWFAKGASRPRREISLRRRRRTGGREAFATPTGASTGSRTGSSCSDRKALRGTRASSRRFGRGPGCHAVDAGGAPASSSAVPRLRSQAAPLSAAGQFGHARAPQRSRIITAGGKVAAPDRPAVELLREAVPCWELHGGVNSVVRR